MIDFEGKIIKAFLSKANDHINSGEIELAINIYLSCLHKYPECIETYNNISVLFNEILQREKAIFYIKKGILASPLSSELYRSLGIFLFESGYENKAYKSFVNAISINRKFDDAYFNLANLFSGYSRSGKVNYIKAINLYKVAIKLNPSNYKAYLNLADLCSDFDEPKIALNNYKKSIELDPKISTPYQSIGEILYKQSQYHKSKKAYEVFIKYNPIIKEWSHKSIKETTQSEYIPKDNIPTNIPSQCIFIPSYINYLNNENNHLFYLHIPKSGGTRFERPLIECIEKWYSKNSALNFRKYLNRLYSEKEIRYILFDGKGGQSFYDFFGKSIPKVDKIDFSFFRGYQSNIRALLRGIYSNLNINPIIIASYRNPKERLRSAIKHLLRNNGNRLDLVRNEIENRNIFLDNSIYRACYDIFDKPLNDSINEKPIVDYLLDLGDFSTLSKLQSQFISKCKLPNILTNNYIHKSPSSQQSDDLSINELIQICIDNDFLKYDMSDKVKNLIIPELHSFEANKIIGNDHIHPVTLVLNTNTSSFYHSKSILVPTNQIHGDKFRSFLMREFQ